MRRRDFISNSVKAGLAFSIIPRSVLGGNGFVAPSDRVNLGFIGVGKQSYILLRGFSKCDQAAIVSASDVDSNKMKNFISEVGKTQQKLKTSTTSVKGYEFYREMLDNKDIDAVVIASPDHWHAQMSIDAAKAGKDIYCEKPLSLTIAESRAMVNASKKYKRVFQTGSMQRSSFRFRQAVELIRNGYIGDIKEINVSVGAPVKQCDLPTMATPSCLNWNEWVGPSPYRGYNSELAPLLEDNVWAGWRWYRDFGGGYIADWGAHMFDIVQWALDMDNSGPVLFIPPTNPLAVDGLSYVYKNGVKVNHTPWGDHNAIQFIGTEGKIEVSRSFLRTSKDGLADLKFSNKDKRVYFSDNHYQDWLDAIKKRTQPICNVETGHRTSSVCNIVNIAYELQREIKWDPTKEVFNDASANMMRTRTYRGKWDFNDY